MVEGVKRLPPTFTTLRDLFVHSGNQCAFSGCDRRLVNHKGQWVGEVCHIRAALAGGERFDPSMTNEDRRHRRNLVLMCHEHHVETNDVDEFTVDRLNAIKAEHEARFQGPAPLPDEMLERAVHEIVAASIEDETDRVVLRPPQTLTRFAAAIGLEETPEERRGTIELLLPVLEALRTVPVDTRAVFSILIDRSRRAGSAELPLHEIEMATRRSPEELAPHVEMLERYGLARLDEEWNDDRPAHMVLSASDVDGWEFWPEFRTYCVGRELDVKDTINQLRFDSLD